MNAEISETMMNAVISETIRERWDLGNYKIVRLSVRPDNRAEISGTIRSIWDLENYKS